MPAAINIWGKCSITGTGTRADLRMSESVPETGQLNKTYQYREARPDERLADSSLTLCPNVIGRLHRYRFDSYNLLVLHGVYD